MSVCVCVCGCLRQLQLALPGPFCSFCGCFPAGVCPSAHLLLWRMIVTDTGSSPTGPQPCLETSASVWSWNLWGDESVFVRCHLGLKRNFTPLRLQTFLVFESYRLWKLLHDTVKPFLLCFFLFFLLLTLLRSSLKLHIFLLSGGKKAVVLQQISLQSSSSASAPELAGRCSRFPRV